MNNINQGSKNRYLISVLIRKVSARLVASVILLSSIAFLIQAHLSFAEKLSTTLLVPLGIRSDQQPYEVRLNDRCFAVLNTRLINEGKLTVLNGEMDFKIAWMGQIIPVNSKFELNFTELDQLGASMLTLTGLGETVTLGTEGISPINLKMIVGGRYLPTLELPGPITLVLGKGKNLFLRVPQRLINSPLNINNPIIAAGGLATLGLDTRGLPPNGASPFSLIPLKSSSSIDSQTLNSASEKVTSKDTAQNSICENMPLDLSNLGALKDLLRIVT